MPGLVIDPDQNSNVEKRCGVAHIFGVLATYDKDADTDMRYKPAGWLINKENVKIKQRTEPFMWRDVVPVIYEIVPKNVGGKIDKDKKDQGKLVNKLFDDAGGDAGTRQKMKDLNITPYKPYEE